MPISLLPKIGFSKKDQNLSHAISAVCPEQMFRTVDIKVTCNNITAMTKFNFWPGILQRIQTYACIQQNISVEPNQEQAVHITEELAVDLIV